MYTQDRPLDQHMNQDQPQQNQQPQQFSSKIIDQITHFFKRNDGSSSRNTLQVEMEDATMKNNYPRDGTIGVRLIKEGGSHVMKLNPAEALQLSNTLGMCAKDLLVQKAELWKKR